MKIVVKAFRALSGFVKLSPKGENVRPHLLAAVAIGVTTVGVTVAGPAAASWAATTGTHTYIVQDGSHVGYKPAAELVQSVGGKVGRHLGLISAVSASLTPAELSEVEAVPGVVVTPDVKVTVQSTTAVSSTSGSSSSTSSGPVDVFTQQTGANTVWANGDEGQGVNVAVLDTGIDQLPDFSGRLVAGIDLSGEGNALEDSYGHGTFVAGLIAGNGVSSNGQYTGEAPEAGLVSVKVAGASGTTDVATVIAGVDWVVQNAQAYGIKVLNMSLGFVPFESTTVNPLDQAVEQAWNSGVTVVASAGNAGPFNGTILSPGDDPLIITVGALADNGLLNVSQDTMTSFSSVGPTFPDGWVKPDLVTSGRSVISLEAPGSTVATQNPTAQVGTANFVGSGTSFASAITAGAAALVLEAHPNDTPNQVKAALLGTTNQGPVGNPFVDGHGALNVAGAVGVKGLTINQSFGDVTITGSMEGTTQIQPGDTVQAGYNLTMPGLNSAATVTMLDATVYLPVSCTIGGTNVGDIAIDLASGPYSFNGSSTGWLPAKGADNASTFEGSTFAPNLCNGQTMYNQGAVFSSEVNSTDTSDQVEVEFHYQDTNTSPGKAVWSSTSTLNAISTTAVGTSVSLESIFASSTWNPFNWKGLSPTLLLQILTSYVTGLVQGSAWNGSAWNGSAWNGSAWNGSAWNGSAWNGSAWNGSAWNGSAWNGSAWNGSAWNGSAWNGSAWNGSAWNGSAWNGSAWNGSAWNGSAWN